MKDHSPGCQLHHDTVSIFDEIMHHLPYAIFSVALGLITLSFLDFFTSGSSEQGAHLLFHSFHFLHIVFAVTGSLITYSRFSNNLAKGIVVSVISSMIFCTLSDVVFPYISGQILGVDVELHICFFSEFHNIVPFLLIGLLNGIVMSRHAHSAKEYYSVMSHFGHILVSSLASLFYLISHGFSDWAEVMGILYVFLIIAVVIPCTLADVVIPVYFARLDKEA